MPYIGRDTDKISNVEVLDNITFDGSSSYTLQKGGSNFTPSSANTLLVSIDGVVQAGNFTVSGSTIDFGVAIAGTSTCDFVLHYGVGLITTPSDGTVTTAKLADSSVSLAKLTATGTKSSSTFLRGDNTFAGAGITEADNWRLTANTNAGSDADVTTNWERSDSNGYTKIGTGLSESSGVFSFATTGIYLITYHAQFSIHGGEVQAVLSLNTTINTSSYVDVCHAIVGNGNGTDGIRGSASSSFIFDVTDISNCKFKFETESMNLTTALVGNTSHSFTSFTTVRLGDT
jgi:hypothetical protein